MHIIDYPAADRFAVKYLGFEKNSGPADE